MNVYPPDFPVDAHRNGGFRGRFRDRASPGELGVASERNQGHKTCRARFLPGHQGERIHRALHFVADGNREGEGLGRRVAEDAQAAGRFPIASHIEIPRCCPLRGATPVGQAGMAPIRLLEGGLVIRPFAGNDQALAGMHRPSDAFGCFARVKIHHEQEVIGGDDGADKISCLLENRGFWRSPDLQDLVTRFFFCQHQLPAAKSLLLAPPRQQSALGYCRTHHPSPIDRVLEAPRIRDERLPVKQCSGTEQVSLLAPPRRTVVEAGGEPSMRGCATGVDVAGVIETGEHLLRLLRRRDLIRAGDQRGE